MNNKVARIVNTVLVVIMVAVLTPWFFSFTKDIVESSDISWLMAFFIKGYPFNFIIASLIFCWLIITGRREYTIREFFTDIFLPMFLAVALSVVIYRVVVDAIDNVGSNVLVTLLLYLTPYLFVLGVRFRIMRNLLGGKDD